MKPTLPLSSIVQLMLVDTIACVILAIGFTRDSVPAIVAGFALIGLSTIMTVVVVVRARADGSPGRRA